MKDKELNTIPKWMLKSLPNNEQQFSHDWWCNCQSKYPIGGPMCSCRIRRDFDTIKKGTYEKPHGIGLIYPTNLGIT